MGPLSNLKQTVFGIHPLREEEWQAFAGIWEDWSMKRKTIMTAPGETERYLYYVMEGVQRAFHLGENNRESTLMFSYPPSFSGIADSFLLQQPSHYYLETLTPSWFLRTDHNRLEALTNELPAIEKWMRKAVSHVLAGLLEGQIEPTSFNAEQKFRVLLKEAHRCCRSFPISTWLPIWVLILLRSANYWVPCAYKSWCSQRFFQPIRHSFDKNWKMNKRILLAELEKDIHNMLMELRQLRANSSDLDWLLCPGQGSWSAAQVIAHLNSYNRYYLPQIEKGIAMARKQSGRPSNEFKPGWLGNYFTRMMKPGKNGEIANRMQSPKDHRPLQGLMPEGVVEEFIRGEKLLIEFLHIAGGLDIGRVRIPISVSRIIKLKLGDVFHFLIAHQQRHFVQLKNAHIHLSGTSAVNIQEAFG